MSYFMIFTFCMIVLSYYVFNKDYFSPSFLLFIGYFFSAVATFYNTVVWHVVISNKLILIMTVGWISFFMGELVVRNIAYKERRKGRMQQDTYENRLHTIKVNRMFMNILLLIDIIILFLFYREVKRIAGDSFSSTGDLVASYKNNLSENGLSFIVQQLIKYIKGLAFVSIFIFCNNYVSENEDAGKRIKNNYIYLLPGIIYVVECLLNGGRYTVLAFLIGFVFTMYYFIQYRDGWKHKLRFKTLMVALGAIVIIFVLFWAVKELVGRDSTATLIEYITEYIGGPYELFSLYLTEPPAKYCYETFAGMINSLNKLGVCNLPIRTYHEFRFSSTGILIGNVYTAFRSYYNDFGVIGVSFLSFLMSLFFNIFYHKIRFLRNVKKNAFIIILYASLLYCVVFSFFVDYFYARFSVGLIIEIFIMYALYYILIKKRIVLWK